MIKPYIGRLVLWLVSALMLSAAEISGLVKDENGQIVTQGYVFVTPIESFRIIARSDIGSNGQYRLSVQEKGGLNIYLRSAGQSAGAAVQINGPNDKIVVDLQAISRWRNV